MRDRQQLYLRQGDTFAVRAQDGNRGAVLGRYQVESVGGRMRCVLIEDQCDSCGGQCQVALAAPVLDFFGPGKHKTHTACGRCHGNGSVVVRPRVDVV